MCNSNAKGVIMKEMLVDLYRHQAWADAESWRALSLHPGALEDKVVFERLYHIHFVQHAYYAIVSKTELVRKRKEEFAQFVTQLSEPEFDAKVVIPWFRNAPVEFNAGQALMQAALHSHYLRGQNATRVRELGGEPPLTDFIAWIWKGKPEPVWPQPIVKKLF
jgi:uncharacterized damage-inducible protein DinB